jgi:hypothetical protein
MCPWQVSTGVLLIGSFAGEVDCQAKEQKVIVNQFPVCGSNREVTLRDPVR